MTALGIDYGLKRVGVAVSDENENFAFPFSVLENSSDSKLAEEVLRICQERKIIDIVLGESKDFKGNDNEIMAKIKGFQQALNSTNPLIQVHFEPEWMTTQQAERFQGKREDIDSSAAAVILQSYLDRKKHSQHI